MKIQIEDVDPGLWQVEIEADTRQTHLLADGDSLTVTDTKTYDLYGEAHVAIRRYLEVRTLSGPPRTAPRRFDRLLRRFGWQIVGA